VKNGRRIKNLFHSKHGSAGYKLIIQHREEQISLRCNCVMYHKTDSRHTVVELSISDRKGAVLWKVHL